jgi:hypothetical protein
VSANGSDLHSDLISRLPLERITALPEMHGIISLMIIQGLEFIVGAKTVLLESQTITRGCAFPLPSGTMKMTF